MKREQRTRDPPARRPAPPRSLPAPAAAAAARRQAATEPERPQPHTPPAPAPASSSGVRSPTANCRPSSGSVCCDGRNVAARVAGVTRAPPRPGTTDPPLNAAAHCTLMLCQRLLTCTLLGGGSWAALRAGGHGGKAIRTKRRSAEARSEKMALVRRFPRTGRRRRSASRKCAWWWPWAGEWKKPWPASEMFSLKSCAEVCVFVSVVCVLAACLLAFVYALRYTLTTRGRACERGPQVAPHQRVQQSFTVPRQAGYRACNPDPQSRRFGCELGTLARPTTHYGPVLTSSRRALHTRPPVPGWEHEARLGVLNLGHRVERVTAVRRHVPRQPAGLGTATSAASRPLLLLCRGQHGGGAAARDGLVRLVLEHLHGIGRGEGTAHFG